MSENTAPEQDQQVRNYRPKIYRVDAKGKVLDFQDFVLCEVDQKGNLEEGKIVLNYTEYDTTTHKSTQLMKHYMDVDVARVVFSDILNLRFRKDPKNAEMFLPILDEYKGGRGAAAGHPEWDWASRHLVVNYNPGLRMGPAIVFNFTLCEGEANATGAVMPKSKDAPFKGMIAVPLTKARAAAATILDYIHNVQTAAMVKSMIASDQAVPAGDQAA
jgi:hypothetical protein